jgi:hypothetical protein
MRDASAWALGHAARGPVRRSLWLGRGARATEGGGGTSVEARVHNDNFTASVHQSKAGKPRGRCSPNARETRCVRWQRRPSQVLFCLSLFEIVKLQKLSTNSKISKNKSCRGAKDLQLSQRATDVLTNRFVGESCWSCSFSTARITVHKGFKPVFG